VKWARLGRGLVATISGPRGRRRVLLRGSTPRSALLGALRVKVKHAGGRRLQVTVSLGTQGGAATKQVAIVVRRGRRALARLTTPLSGGHAGGTVRWLTPRLTPGRLTVDVIGVATGPPAGAAQVPSIATVRRSVTFNP